MGLKQPTDEGARPAKRLKWSARSAHAWLSGEPTVLIAAIVVFFMGIVWYTYTRAHTVSVLVLVLSV